MKNINKCNASYTIKNCKNKNIYINHLYVLHPFTLVFLYEKLL